MPGAERPPPTGLEELGGDLATLLALLDPDAALQGAARLVTREVGVPVGFVAVPESAEAVRIDHFHGTRTDALRGVVVPTGYGLGGKVAALRTPVWVSDYCTNASITHHFDGPVRAEGLRGMIAVPLQRGATFYGVLYGGAREEGEFGSRAAAEMEAVAARAALALQVAERARHAVEQAVCAERVRLSAALHDSVGASLFAIGAGARELAATAGHLPGVAERARDLERRAGGAAADLRRSLRALQAAPQELALGATLQADCEAFQQRTGVRARAIALTALPPLEPAAEAAVVAAVREALLNVEKHAGAGSVVVTLSAMAGAVAVAVTDDGRGLADRRALAPGTAGGERGLGLEAAAVRMARLGGSLQIAQNDDGGVTLRAWVPC